MLLILLLSAATPLRAQLQPSAPLLLATTDSQPSTAAPISYQTSADENLDLTASDNLSLAIADSIIQAAADSLIQTTTDSMTRIGSDSIIVISKDSLANEEWAPDPARATWMGIAFPGGGQIYNRKFWKLPIVYGGFLGCAYALTWNNQMYRDYSQAYLDIMDDDPATASYEDFLPPNYNVDANQEYLKKVFKNRKDNYRRYRDLSIFSFIGVYAISIIDAYVDAELSHFDISEDLGLRIRPSIIPSTNSYSLLSNSLGVNCSLSF